jgi:D-hydroxyproline dehydrogenase subunit gamma
LALGDLAGRYQLTPLLLRGLLWRASPGKTSTVENPQIEIHVNGSARLVAPGTTVAAAILEAGGASFRHSVKGQPRGPLCGMGICFECRVCIDGVPHVRSCQVLCREGMRVVTDDAR